MDSFLNCKNNLTEKVHHKYCALTNTNKRCGFKVFERVIMNENKVKDKQLSVCYEIRKVKNIHITMYNDESRPIPCSKSGLGLKFNSTLHC